MSKFINSVMVTNWSVKRIAGVFGVSRAFAKLYLQPCATPDQVEYLLACRAALDLSTH